MAGARTLERVGNRLNRARWALAAGIVPRRRVRAGTVSFTLQCDNWITHFRWKSYTRKEPETLDWLDRMLGAGDVLFDVGANIGLYSLYSGLRHPGLAVIAFEPEYANLHLLRDNILGNALADRVEAYSIALSERSGISRLHVQDLTPGAALHTEAAEARAVTDAGQRVVWSEGIWSMRMDDFCTDRGLWPTAIKIDVDGGEARVLSGAAAALSRAALRTVLVEVSDDAGACARLLRQAGLERADAGQPTKSGNQVWVRAGTAPAGEERA